MILIIGGAYQGKLDYAKKTFDINENEIFVCGNAEIDFAKKCIYGIEEFVYACIQENVDAIGYFKDRKAEWKNSVLICQDISCGVVPLGADMRQWRQVTGQLCKYLASEATSVKRIFCGLEQELK